MSALIEVSGLHLAYSERPILTGVDLQVEEGEVAIVLGGSGCGKSTLLKAILGLEVPQQGQVRIFGQDPSALPEEEAQDLRRRLGVVFQQGALFSSLTAAENVALPLQMHTDLDAESIAETAAGLLAMVGMGRAAGLLPAQLSGGMRQRVALARALALGPQLLCCDEPSAGLDPVAGAEIDRLLLHLNRTLGTTLLVVTHHLLSIERLAGRLIMLDGGQVVFAGSLAQARRCDLPVVSRFFNAGAKTWN
ncbi:MAG: ATP-binding cassette domain-containing protein [Candidatus Latescibacteria bacterium]|nr:ATP-binding cassette domain-containing protein [Candidatus Latescibacterota bacterium]